MSRYLTDDEIAEAQARYRARTDAAREQHGEASVEHRIAGLEEAWYRTDTDLLKAQRRIATLEQEVRRLRGLSGAVPWTIP